jgi:hypothetical protein
MEKETRVLVPIEREELVSELERINEIYLKLKGRSYKDYDLYNDTHDMIYGLAVFSHAFENFNKSDEEKVEFEPDSIKVELKDIVKKGE